MEPRIKLTKDPIDNNLRRARKILSKSRTIKISTKGVVLKSSKTTY